VRGPLGGVVEGKDEHVRIAQPVVNLVVRVDCIVQVTPKDGAFLTLSDEESVAETLY
jgi:hypothetical protein